jgi:hypothetical protein
MAYRDPAYSENVRIAVESWLLSNAVAEARGQSESPKEGTRPSLLDDW